MIFFFTLSIYHFYSINALIMTVQHYHTVEINSSIIHIVKGGISKLIEQIWGRGGS